MLKAGFALLCGLVMVTGVAAEVLIKESEAKLPPAPVTSQATRAITRGPAIRVVSPEGAVASPFLLRVVFEPRGGARIDLSSLKITYLRTPNVDLLNRVRGGLSEKGIDIASAEAPPGEHQIRLSVQDSEGRQTSTLLNLNVVK